MTSPSTSPYDKSFYATIADGARHSAQAVVPMLVELLKPVSVVDVGCGTGAWLDGFRHNGVKETVGIDGPWRQSFPGESHEFLTLDLRSGFSLGRTFDLVTSLEVAEHLPAASAAAFVRSLTQLGPQVVFSAAVPYQGGTDHINEQWPEYWAEIFGRYGYLPVDCIRPRIWQMHGVEWWYAQNMLLYVRREHLASRPHLQRLAAETAGRPLSLVHPRAYVDRSMTPVQADAISFSALMRLAPRVFVNAVSRRLTRYASRTGAP